VCFRKGEDGEAIGQVVLCPGSELWLIFQKRHSAASDNGCPLGGLGKCPARTASGRSRQTPLSRGGTFPSCLMLCAVLAYKLLQFRCMISALNVVFPGRCVKVAWLPALFVTCFLSLLSASAATIGVFPGQSIQAAINGGTAGDTVVIFEGTYNEDITISKLVKLAKPQDAKVVIGGSLTLSGLTSPYVLHDFTIGVDRSKRVTVQNCADVILQDLNLASAAGFTATNTPKLTVLRVDNTGGTGSSVTDSARFETKHSRIDSALSLSRSNSILRQGTYGAVNSDRGDFYLLGGSANSVNVSGQSKSVASGTGSTNAVFFQSNVGDRLVSNAAFTWIGYSNLQFVTLAGGSHAVVVGNNINGRNQASEGWACGVRISETSGALRVKISNNVIQNMGTNQGVPKNGGEGWKWGGVGVFAQAGGALDISNNIFAEITGQDGAYLTPSVYTGKEGGAGIYIASDRGVSSQVSVFGNIFYNIARAGSHADLICAIRAPFENVVFSGNAVHMLQGVEAKGGVVPSGTTTLTSAPSFEPSTFFKLPSTSPLKRKGPNDARFNNFDGTRNDLGIWGGTQFDPDGRTTTKPVVLGFDITPDQILEGTATQVRLMNIGAVMIEP
jgi:hypothetical protein